MKVPRFVEGLTVLLWGWHTDFIWVAIPMAILLETRHFTRRRWDLARRDFYRLADLTTFGVVAAVIYIFNSVGLNRLITAFIELTPIVFFPLVLVHAYSTSERFSLDILFYSMRKQAELPPPVWDAPPLYIGVCLVAGATNMTAALYFLPLAAAVLGACLWANRPRRYHYGIWLTVFGACFAAGYVTQYGIHQLHMIVKEKSTEWLANLTSGQTDPYRTRTAIGAVGQLKLSDRILFRVAADRGRAPSLLHEAAYDRPMGTDWLRLEDDAEEPLIQVDEFDWLLASGPEDAVLTIYLPMSEEEGIVPAPYGTARIVGFPALEVRRSYLGTLEASGIMPVPSFDLRHDAREPIDHGEPNPVDTHMAPNLLSVIESSLGDGIRNLEGDRDKVRYVKDYFSGFRYSLYQPAAATDLDALEDFLTVRRAGHCEFFATATALMLRYAGVPARYAVGYAIEELDPLTDTYLVRARHAHAWVLAYVEDRWEIVDTTPSTWLRVEEAQSSPLQPVIDLGCALVFGLQRWWLATTEDDLAPTLYTALALLFAFLVWRLYRSDQVLIGEGGETRDGTRTGDSPFYRIESRLEAAGLPRGPGETLSSWLTRIRRPELEALLPDHYALRFDPRGLSEARRRRLEAAVTEWLDNHPEAGTERSVGNSSRA